MTPVYGIEWYNCTAEHKLQPGWLKYCVLSVHNGVKKELYVACISKQAFLNLLISWNRNNNGYFYGPIGQCVD